MLAVDRDALICDMAETYRIYDIYAFRPKQVAVFASGLGPDSRIRLKLAGISPRSTQELLAHIADNLAILRYRFTAQSGDDLPTLFTDLIQDNQPEKSGAVESYQDGNAFSEAWKRLTKGGENG